MTLPDCISNNMERLRSEWIEFAQTRLPAADLMSVEALSDGSKELLLSIADDLGTFQSEPHRLAKSRGEKDVVDSAIGRASRKHAKERLNSGFTLDQVVAEYRALRATVVRGWTSDMASESREKLDELIRFDEAMDQSLTEAVRWFDDELERMRDTFVGILGHDLCDPLSAAMSANELQHLAQGKADIQSKANAVTRKNLKRMVVLVHDLLDFARTRLDDGLPVSPKPADMGKVCREIVEALELSRHVKIRLTLSDDLNGRWDADRIEQLVANLLRNALEHGDPATPVEMAARAEGDDVVLTVHNEGSAIPLERQLVIYQPFNHPRGGEKKRDLSPYSLGLGLYIVKQIAEAHNGAVAVDSSAESGTTFTVRLPKHLFRDSVDATAGSAMGCISQ